MKQPKPLSFHPPESLTSKVVRGHILQFFDAALRSSFLSCDGEVLERRAIRDEDLN